MASELSVPFSYYRGGTSKALFFHEHDIPPSGKIRDLFLRRIMGSPDPMQIDGMGGTHVVTSKIGILSKSSRPDADVDYTFAQVGIKEAAVGYDGNCGNISAAVGPFAIREGLIDEFRPGVSIEKGLKTQEVRIYNTGTRKVLISHIPIDDYGNVVDRGDYSIAGCPGKAAPILLDYKDTIGETCFPTGNVVDTTEVDGRQVQYTFCDIANQVVFARAADLDISGDEPAAHLDDSPAVISKVKELRGKAAQRVGMCSDWTKVDEETPMLPMVSLVSKSTTEEGHLQSRLFLNNECHTSMAGTGATNFAACSRIPGTVIHQMIDPKYLEESMLNIQHPSGIMPVAVKTKAELINGQPQFETLSFVRTARRIMKGELDVPDDIKEQYIGQQPKGHN